MIIHLFSIPKLDVVHDQSELVEPFDPLPAFLGGLEQFEHHRYSQDKEGRFIRQTSPFRNWITSDRAPGPTGKGGFKAEKGRYHLYVAYICPWASRALMARKLKGLKDGIGVTIVNSRLTDQDWALAATPAWRKIHSTARAIGTSCIPVPIHNLWSRHCAGALGQTHGHHRE